MLRLINEGPLDATTAGLPQPFTAEDARNFVERPVDKLLPHFFITLPNANGGELIGGTGLGRDGDEVALGYWITQAHHGHGYASEAISAMLSLARTLGHRRVIASSIFDGPKSDRVLESAGFKPSVEVRSRLSTLRPGGSTPRTFVIDLSASIDLEDNSDDDDPQVSNL